MFFFQNELQGIHCVPFKVAPQLSKNQGRKLLDINGMIHGVAFHVGMETLLLFSRFELQCVAAGAFYDSQSLIILSI